MSLLLCWSGLGQQSSRPQPQGFSGRTGGGSHSRSLSNPVYNQRQPQQMFSQPSPMSPPVMVWNGYPPPQHNQAYNQYAFGGQAQGNGQYSQNGSNSYNENYERRDNEERRDRDRRGERYRDYGRDNGRDRSYGRERERERSYDRNYDYDRSRSRR